MDIWEDNIKTGLREGVRL